MPSPHIEHRFFEPQKTPNGFFQYESLEGHTLKLNISGRSQEVDINLFIKFSIQLFADFYQTYQRGAYLIIDFNGYAASEIRARQAYFQFLDAQFRQGHLWLIVYLRPPLPIEVLIKTLQKFSPHWRILIAHRPEEALPKIHQIEQWRMEGTPSLKGNFEWHHNGQTFLFEQIEHGRSETAYQEKAAGIQLHFLKSEPATLSAVSPQPMREENRMSKGFLILDLSALPLPETKAAQNDWMAWLEYLSEPFSQGCLIVAPHDTEKMALLHQRFFSNKWEYSRAFSWQEAVATALATSRQGPDETANNLLFSNADALSKEELLELVGTLRKELEQEYRQQQRRTNELLRFIANITQERPQLVSLSEFEKNEGFQQVKSVVSLLQYDIMTMVQQLEISRRELESTVAKRTKELATQKEMLDRIADSSPAIIFIYDLQKNSYTYANRAFERITGYHLADFSDFTAVKMGELVHPEDQLHYMGSLMKLNALNAGEVSEFEYRFRHDKGHWLWLMSRAVVFQANNEGQATQILGFTQDISERKEAENKILRNQQLLKSINSNINEGIFRCSEDGILVYINRACARLLGYQSRSEILGNSFANYIDFQNFCGFLNEQPKQREKTSNFEVRFKKKDDQTFPGLLNFIQTRDNDGNIFYDGTFSDITEQIEAAEKLRQRNEELQKVNFELDKFVYSVSHDLRAPLASIMGLIELLKSETDIARIRIYLDLQDKSVRRLDHFIQEIIDLSRNARQEVAVEPINFQELMNEISETYAYMPEFRQTRKIIEIEQPNNFYSDAKRLKIVLGNLFANALRYHLEWSQDKWVKVNIKTSPEQAIIEVSDNGMGIDETHLPFIFDMFYRATQEKHGSGLGLYIVKETLKKLGGEIRVESVLGKGTTFSISLPPVVPSLSDPR